MNTICIVGRLARDPEARTTQGGVSQSKFTVAATRDFKNAEGKYDADFFTCIAWRGTADFCNKYLTKGRLVEIVGRVQTGKYEKDGATRYTFDVMVNGIKPLDRAEGGNQGTGNRQQGTAEAAGQVFEEVDDAGLPF